MLVCFAGAFILYQCLSALLVFSDILSSAGANVMSSAALLVLLQSANNWWPPAGRSATGLLPAAVQVFVNDMESPKYLHWLGAASLEPPSHWLAPAHLPLDQLGGGSGRCEGRGFTYRHNKLKLKPVCHRIASLFIFNRAAARFFGT